MYEGFLLCFVSTRFLDKNLKDVKILTAFTVISVVDLSVVFTWTPSATPLVASRDAALARLLRLGDTPAEGAPAFALACFDVPVAVQRIGDLIYASFAGTTDDELTAVAFLSSAVAVLSATCEEELPTAPRIASFYGKIVVCLHEAFGGQGFLLHSDVDSILRNSKLKAPLT
jgi:hypothetical protein